MEMDEMRFERLSNEIAMLQIKIEYIEKLLNVNGLPFNLNEKISVSSIKEKCSSNYNKRDLSQLFYVLMNEEILFFDKNNENSNRSKMQGFIVDNFTYLGDSGIQTPLKTISKQFSEVKGFTYRDRHLKFLDKMLEILHQRREQVAKK
jgi:hypothetical protein